MKPAGHAIAIAGAGLGGLTAALALIRRGWRVTVYEQAPVLGEAGAGISLSPGAGRALTALGIGPALLEASSPVPNVAFVHYRSGDLLAGDPSVGNTVDRGFETARHIHRADLHRILLEAVVAADAGAVRTNKHLVNVVAGVDSVTMHFADGTQAWSDILIAADGTRSIVRRSMFDPSAPDFAGQVAFRCLIPRAAAEPFMGMGTAVVSVGKKRIFHRYLVRGGTLLNVIGIGQSENWREEGWNTPATNAEFLEAYSDFHPNVRGLILAAPRDSLIKWGLFVRQPIAQWSLGRVVLLGDAAHPILPFLGLGAALAIEDGVVLARALEQAETFQEGFALYQSARLDRVENVRTQTIIQGEIIQANNPDQEGLGASPSQNGRLFDYDPTTVRLHA